MSSSVLSAPRGGQLGPGYKWVVLSNTTIAVILATMNSTSLIIALPVIFRGINLNPLDPSNFPFLLWILMGYMLITAVLVVTVGRIGDMFGRVRIYNIGFALFTIGSVLLSLTWSHGTAGAVELIVLRMFQAIGGTCLMANSAAIITDAFPTEQLGLGLGINMVAAIFGSFFGILAGGLLSQVGWRWVFLVNVPFGIFGTIWAYLKLREIGVHRRSKIDWLGNIAFAAGLGALLVGVTYGIKPYGNSLTGWGDPFVLIMIAAGIVVLAAFIVIELKVPEPMFRLSLFRVRAFAFGNIAQFLAAIGRGGMQFMLIIWFQGIWLPQHGYDFTVTPLWSGIYMLPLMIAFVVAGPIAGRMSDRYGARWFATAGMLLSALAYVGIMSFSPNFSYVPFAVVMAVSGLGMGMFAAPNTSSIMNSVPARERGAASGMRVTFGNAGMPLSMGLFFTLMVIGLNAKVPAAMNAGLRAHGVSAAAAAQVSHLPPLGYLFASLLGYNPLRQLLGPQVLNHLPAGQAAVLTSRSFFPSLIGAPFKHGLVLILSFAVAMSIVAAAASALRGKKFVHAEAGSTIGDGRAAQQAAVAVAASGNGAAAPASGAALNGDTVAAANGDAAAGTNGDGPVASGAAVNGGGANGGAANGGGTNGGKTNGGKTNGSGAHRRPGPMRTWSPQDAAAVPPAPASGASGEVADQPPGPA